MPKRKATRLVTLTDWPATSDSRDGVRVVPAATEFRNLAEWDWVYLSDRPRRLHHLSGFEDDPHKHYASVSAIGTSTCGIEGRFHIPGMFSRMGMPRCARCCDRLGWPRGVGSPKNDKALRPLVEARIGAEGGPPISEKSGPPQEDNDA